MAVVVFHITGKPGVKCKNLFQSGKNWGIVERQTVRDTSTQNTGKIREFIPKILEK